MKIIFLKKHLKSVISSSRSPNEKKKKRKLFCNFNRKIFP
jgi:hypothetical protein